MSASFSYFPSKAFLTVLSAWALFAVGSPFAARAQVAETSPSITIQPSSITIVPLQAINLQVQATGGNITYQWYAGTSGDTSKPVLDATSATFAPTPLAATASFWARASNSAGSTDSSTATVTLDLDFTYGGGNPVEGFFASFSYKNGYEGVGYNRYPGPATFQWQRNGIDIPGAIYGAYNLARVTAEDAGTYRLVITHSIGTFVSTPKTLTVQPLPPPRFDVQPGGGPIYPLKPYTLTAHATALETVTYQWYIGESGNTSKPVTGATGTSFTPEPFASTTSFWVRATAPHGTADSWTATETVITPSISGGGFYPLGSLVRFDLLGSTFAPLSFQWQKDGVDIPGATASAYAFFLSNASDFGIYRLVLTTAQGTLYSEPKAIVLLNSEHFNGSVGTYGQVPVGGTATLDVDVSGANLTYEWSGTYNLVKLDGSKWEGTHSRTLTIPQAQLTDQGYYQCTVYSNGAFAGYSTSFWVNIVPPQTFKPTFVTQPLGATINPSQSYSLTALASSASAVTYQWYAGQSGDSSHPISGATATNYTPTTLGATTSFWVRATAQGASADSNTATITVTAVKPAPPTFVTQPLSANINSSQSYTLTALATSTSAVTYQWYTGQSSDSSHPINGATATSFTPTRLASTTSFWVRAMAQGVSADSATAVIIVLPPSITGGGSVAVGTIAEFDAINIPVGIVSFQWQKNGVNLSDATSAYYTFKVTSLTQAGDYRLAISTPDGILFTNTVKLEVPPFTALAIVTQPHSTWVYPGQSLTPQSAIIFPDSGQTLSLNIHAVGQGRIYYSWFMGSSGDTTNPIWEPPFFSSEEFRPSFTSYGVFKYWVRAGDSVTSVDSDTFTVNFLEKMTAVFTGDTHLTLHKNIAATVIAPGAATFKADGLPPGVFITPATGVLYGSPTASGKFTVRISAHNGYVTSNVVTVLLDVAPLGSMVTGSFVGVIERDPGANDNLGGQITLTVASSGVYTGKFNLGTVPHSFMGMSTTTETNCVHAVAGPAPTAPLPHAAIDCIVSAITGAVDGTITQTARDGTLSSARFHAVRNGWTSGSLRSTPYAGSFTAALQANPDLFSTGDYPEGASTLCTSVGTNGTVSLAARLADNTVLTAASIVGLDHSIPIYWALYGGTGSILGWQTLAPNATYGCVADGTLTWFKQPQSAKTTTRSYAKGFPVHELTLIGSKLVVPGKNQIELGLPDKPNNAVIRFVKSNLSSDNAVPFRITTANAAQWPAGSKVSLSIDKATGKFSGYWAPSGTSIPFYGVFVSRLNAGIGSFQFAATDSGKDATVSGAVLIQAAQ